MSTENLSITPPIVALFERHPDLAGCVFPTVKDQDTASIRPAYPKGGFDPGCQSMTLEGVEMLARIDHYEPYRWMTIPGIKSSVSPTEHQVLGPVVGACIKPIRRAIITFDFDFPVGQMPALDVWLERNPDVILVRGNRERLTMIMRQSPELMELSATMKNRVIFAMADDQRKGWKVEVALREGASNNLFGAHKSGREYQTFFPETLGEMSVANFREMTRIITDFGFAPPKNTSSNSSRVSVHDLFGEDFEIEKLRLMGKSLSTLNGEDNGEFLTVRPDNIVANTIHDCIHGKSMYVSGQGWQPSYGLVSDGFRRDTAWQVLTDLAMVKAVMDEMRIPYTDGIWEAIVQKLSLTFEVEIGTMVPVQVNEIYIRCQKWSYEYLCAEWIKFRDDESRHTIRPENVGSFVAVTLSEASKVIKGSTRYQEHFAKKQYQIKPPIRTTKQKVGV
jgi:hypothetical protein